jgi:hypothetical protein
MERLSGKQSSVPEDRMERGLERGNSDLGLGDGEKQKKDGCHIAIQDLL